MLRRIALVLMMTSGLLLANGCSDDGPGDTAAAKKPQGTLRLVTQALADDVNGVLYEITCVGGESITQYVPLESEGLPAHIDLSLAGQPFADFFTVVSPGTCTVTATAMLDADTPAPDCKPVKKDVVVKANQTTEVVLVIECTAKPTGGLDLVTVITDNPSITNVIYSDSKFIVQCEPLNVTIEAEGGSGNLTYTFEVTGSPDGAVYEASSKDNVFTFWAETPGEYTVTVTVSDGTSSTTMTFPIHVGDNPDVEHCDEACCQLPDGHTFFGLGTTCTEKGGTIVSDDVCTAEICCKTIDGVLFVPAGDCPQGAIQPAEACELAAVACCRNATTGALTFAASAAACQKSGGTVVPDAICEADVCCKMADGVAIVPAAECAVGQEVQMELCAPVSVCCSLPGLIYQIMTDAECIAQGKIVSMELCLPEVCCLNAEGDVSLTPQTTCTNTGGTAVAIEQCNEVCCQFKQILNPYPQLMTLHECEEGAGFVTDPAKCDNVTHVWQANATVDPDVECNPEPYLVVPSSGANKLAVYDMTTLLHLPTSPFPTCANPSRILMDGNTDVYASCRSDGHVAKHTRDGVLLWNTQLPGCNTARGIALSGDGRLFVGCSDSPGSVHEVNPVTGAPIMAVALTWPVYGLSVDSDSLFIGGFAAHRVGKMNLGGPLDGTIAWEVSQPSYGLAADGIGGVWITGPSLRLLDGADGTVVDSVPSPAGVGYMTGAQVGLDGRVYAAAYGNQKVLRYDPSTDTTSVLNTHGTASDVHGLTLDVDHNVYTINRASQDLTKITPANVNTPFGGGILVQPYGYSGDMTGIQAQCLASTTNLWYSAAHDSGSPATLWTTITWSATTPPGSSVSIYVRLDGGAWTAVSNGQNLNLTGQVLEVKALLASTIPGNEPTLNTVSVVYVP